MFLFGPDDFLRQAVKGKALPLAYQRPLGDLTPVAVFRILGGANSFLLDSAGGSPELNEYSLAGFDPFHLISTHGDDPFAELRSSLAGFCPGDLNIDLPVWGGAFGFLSYDCARFIEPIPNSVPDDLGLPEASFMFPRLLLVFDLRRALLSVVVNEVVGEDALLALRNAEGRLKRALDALENAAQQTDSLPPTPGGPVTANMSQAYYEGIVRRAKEYIRAGDIFQTNLSVRFEVPVPDDALALYLRLRSINPAPFAAFLDFGHFQLASSSPERLVLLKDGVAETRPIAGTRRRGVDEAEDETLTADLLLNEKERAEHVMLVDLERNDLGRISRYGTVKPTELFAVEKYSHVIHIVSNIVGEVRPGLDQIDVARAVFPGGTITGCPKVRCMEIIEELEPSRRGPYTGSIGYFGFNGNMDLNIVIRTFVVRGDKAYVQAGAGVVADSDPAREYHEAVSKAAALLQAAGVSQEDIKWETLPT